MEGFNVQVVLELSYILEVVWHRQDSVAICLPILPHSFVSRAIPPHASSLAVPLVSFEATLILDSTSPNGFTLASQLIVLEFTLEFCILSLHFHIEPPLASAVLLSISELADVDRSVMVY